MTLAAVEIGLEEGRGGARFAAFVALALALHLGLFWLWPRGSEGGPNGAGAGGEDVVSLAPVDGSLDALIAEWEQPPQTNAPAPEMPVPADPASDAAPDVAATVAPEPAAPPQMDLPAPVPDAPPAPVVVPPDPPKSVGKSVQPAAKPAGAAKPVKPRRAQAGSTAAGSGGGTVAGVNGQAAQGSLNSGARRSALADWGGQIRARIERAKRPPAGGGTGRVMLALRVGRDGRLVSASVAQSSGQAALDAAALAAVRAAGRFPAAPPELADQGYTFTLPLRFQR